MVNRKFPPSVILNRHVLHERCRLCVFGMVVAASCSWPKGQIQAGMQARYAFRSNHMQGLLRASPPQGLCRCVPPPFGCRRGFGSGGGKPRLCFMVRFAVRLGCMQRGGVFCTIGVAAGSGTKSLSLCTR